MRRLVDPWHGIPEVRGSREPEKVSMFFFFSIKKRRFQQANQTWSFSKDLKTSKSEILWFLCFSPKSQSCSNSSHTNFGQVGCQFNCAQNRKRTPSRQPSSLVSCRRGAAAGRRWSRRSSGRPRCWSGRWHSQPVIMGCTVTTGLQPLNGVAFFGSYFQNQQKKCSAFRKLASNWAQTLAQRHSLSQEFLRWSPRNTPSRDPNPEAGDSIYNHKPKLFHMKVKKTKPSL